jgi:hypothetical protein
MAEHVSSTLKLMRDELAAQRERRDADHTGTGRTMAAGNLALKRGRALVLVPTSPLSPPAPRPDPFASRMSIGAWSGWPSSSGEPSV